LIRGWPRVLAIGADECIEAALAFVERLNSAAEYLFPVLAHPLRSLIRMAWRVHQHTDPIRFHDRSIGKMDVGTYSDAIIAMLPHKLADSGLIHLLHWNSPFMWKW
jgi:hypothetical protein